MVSVATGFYSYGGMSRKPIRSQRHCGVPWEWKSGLGVTSTARVLVQYVLINTGNCTVRTVPVQRVR